MTSRLEEKTLCTDPVIIGLEGYWFEITEESITRHSRKGQETSPGYLVRTHFQPVCLSLYLTRLLKDGGVKEAIGTYWANETEKNAYEKALSLNQACDALVMQISLMTDGRYDAYYEDCRKRHDGEESDTDLGELPYEAKFQDIFWYILDLKEGKYHGSENPRYSDRRGIPRIETTGERLNAALLDLIWRMDHRGDYVPPEEADAMERFWNLAKKVYPDESVWDMLYGSENAEE